MDGNGRRLIRAARLGSLTEVWRLLKLDPSLVGAQDGDGMTPLLWAAREGHMAVARVLLQHGALVNHMDLDGHSALYEACAHGRAAVALMLLHDYHADVRIKDWQQGLSPLMAACDEDGHAELVASILRICPSEAYERDWGGRTALWWACFWGAPKQLLHLLLHHGRADYSTPDHHGRTPLDVATLGYEHCRTLITEAAAEGERAYYLYKGRRLLDLQYVLDCTPQSKPIARPLPQVQLSPIYRRRHRHRPCKEEGPRHAVAMSKGEGEEEEVVQGGGGVSPRKAGHVSLMESPRGPALGGGGGGGEGQWGHTQRHSTGDTSTPLNSEAPTSSSKGGQEEEEVLLAVCGYVLSGLPADLFDTLFQHLWYPLGEPHGTRGRGEGSSTWRQWHHLAQQQPVEQHTTE